MWNLKRPPTLYEPFQAPVVHAHRLAWVVPIGEEVQFLLAADHLLTGVEQPAMAPHLVATVSMPRSAIVPAILFTLARTGLGVERQVRALLAEKMIAMH